MHKKLEGFTTKTPDLNFSKGYLVHHIHLGIMLNNKTGGQLVIGFSSRYSGQLSPIAHHRMPEWQRMTWSSGGHLVQLPCSSTDIQTSLIRSTSWWLLKIFKEASQPLWETYSRLCPQSLVLLPNTNEKSSLCLLCTLHFHYTYIHGHWWDLLSILFSRL